MGSKMFIVGKAYRNNLLMYPPHLKRQETVSEKINWFTEMGWEESVRTCYYVRRIPEGHEPDVKPEWAWFWKESWGWGDEATVEAEKVHIHLSLLIRCERYGPALLCDPRRGAKKEEVIQVQAWFSPSVSKNGWDAKSVGRAA